MLLILHLCQFFAGDFSLAFAIAQDHEKRVKQGWCWTSLSPALEGAPPMFIQ